MNLENCIFVLRAWKHRKLRNQFNLNAYALKGRYMYTRAYGGMLTRGSSASRNTVMHKHNFDFSGSVYAAKILVSLPLPESLRRRLSLGVSIIHDRATSSIRIGEAARLRCNLQLPTHSANTHFSAVHLFFPSLPSLALSPPSLFSFASSHFLPASPTSSFSF